MPPRRPARPGPCAPPPARSSVGRAPTPRRTRWGSASLSLATWSRERRARPSRGPSHGGIPHPCRCGVWPRGLVSPKFEPTVDPRGLRAGLLPRKRTPLLCPTSGSLVFLKLLHGATPWSHRSRKMHPVSPLIDLLTDGLPSGRIWGPRGHITRVVRRGGLRASLGFDRNAPAGMPGRCGQLRLVWPHAPVNLDDCAGSRPGERQAAHEVGVPCWPAVGQVLTGSCTRRLCGQRSTGVDCDKLRDDVGSCHVNMAISDLQSVEAWCLTFE